MSVRHCDDRNLPPQRSSYCRLLSSRRESQPMNSRSDAGVIIVGRGDVRERPPFPRYGWLSRVSRSAAIAVFVGLLFVRPAPLRAEAPVNQCTDPGQSAIAPTASGTGFTPGPNLSAPTVSSSAVNVGSVDPKTGAFSFSNEDLAVGGGEFPARLAVVRTYRSDMDGTPSQDQDRDAPYEPGARKPLPFGRGSTHSLDIRYERTRQSFAGAVYEVILLKFGFQTVAFQKCSDGSFVNTKSDGSRLFLDNTYPNGGYRYESRSGDVLLFQALPPNGTGTYYCGKQEYCGVLRRWAAPNGDWAQFDYEQYYSHPTNRAEPRYMSWTTIDSYQAATTACHPNFAGANECHQMMFGTNYVNSNPSGAIPSFPVYNWRLLKVSNSRGHEIRLQYVDSSVDVGGPCSVSWDGYPQCSTAKNTGLQRSRIQTATGFWTAPGGSSTQLRQATYGYSDCEAFAPDCLTSATAADGGTTQYAYTYTYQSKSLSITPPGYAAPVTTVSYTLGNGGYYYRDRLRGYNPPPEKLIRDYYRVTSQTGADGSTVQYNATLSNKWAPEAYGTWDWPEYVSSMQVVAPGNAITTYNYVDSVDDHDGPLSVVNPLNATTTNTYSPAGALLSTALPEGNKTTFSYDARGNLLTTTRYPKPGFGDPVQTITSTYWADPSVTANACANQFLCNRPTSRSDARGAQTDYSWDAGTGLLTGVTGPAGGDGLRPMSTYAYGSYSGAGAGTVLLLATKTERIDPTRNVTTSYGYSGDIRLAPREVAITGDGSTLRGCFKTDVAGNLISHTSPRANLGSCP